MILPPASSAAAPAASSATSSSAIRQNRLIQFLVARCFLLQQKFSKVYLTPDITPLTIAFAIPIVRFTINLTGALSNAATNLKAVTVISPAAPTTLPASPKALTMALSLAHNFSTNSKIWFLIVWQPH